MLYQNYYHITCPVVHSRRDIYEIYAVDNDFGFCLQHPYKVALHRRKKGGVQHFVHVEAAILNLLGLAVVLVNDHNLLEIKEQKIIEYLYVSTGIKFVGKQKIERWNLN